MLKKLRDNWSLVVGFTVALILALILFSPKVSVEKRYLASGMKNQKIKNYEEAVDDFERVLRYKGNSQDAVKAARYAAEICLYDLKNFKRAEYFFRHVVRESQDPEEVRWAQRNLGELFYDRLNNYADAIVEYQRLLDADLPKDAVGAIKLKIARAYFYLSNFQQAISESEEFLRSFPDDPHGFEFNMLIGNAYQSLNQTEKAIQAFELVERLYPNNKDVSQAKLNRALAYENKQSWDQAIKVLEEVRPVYPYPDVIDIKIKGIERRKARKKE